MTRLLVAVTLGLVAVGAGGCVDVRDCGDVCMTLRDCGMLLGTSRDTCEVRCAAVADDHEDAIDGCGSCAEDTCDSSCLGQCVCALDLEPDNYPGMSCNP